MSRVKGRRPPKYVPIMNYPKPVSADEEITFPRQQRLTDKEIEHFLLSRMFMSG